MKYFFLNKELSTTTGEVVVRKVSLNNVPNDEVTAELGDDNWVRYTSEDGQLPAWLRYDADTERWNSNPPEDWKIKHMYTNIDMYGKFFHEGNLDLSEFKSADDNTYFKPIEINNETVIVYPNNSKMKSFKPDGTEVNMIYINDRGNLRLVESSGNTPINVEHVGDLLVDGNIFAKNKIQSENDVVVKKVENGKAKLYSLMDLWKELEKLKAELEEVKKLDNSPIGSIHAFSNLESIPLDYLICNGKTFDENTYPELRALLRSNKLPDLRGVFLRGLDMGRNIDIAREPMNFQEGSRLTVPPHRHITGSYKFTDGNTWIPVQDLNKTIRHDTTELFSGRELDGSGNDDTVRSSLSVSGFGGRTVTYTTYQTEIAPGSNSSQRTLHPDNVTVIYAIKAANLHGKKTGHTDDISGGLTEKLDTLDVGLNEFQFNKIRLLYSLMNDKYDKVGGPVNGDIDGTNLTCDVRIDIDNGGYFDTFNDLAERFESDLAYEEGYILSNVNGVASRVTADESDYVLGLSIEADHTGMLLNGYDIPENLITTPIILKGRGYAHTVDKINKGSKLYLSNELPGLVTTTVTKHFVGYAVTDSDDNGMVRVFVRT